MSDTKYMIANNIKNLRIAWGETQEELGRALNLEGNTISMYEKGKRQPDLQTLEAIANHYCVSVERLMQEDFSETNFKIDSLTWEKVVSLIEIQFPLVYSERAGQDRSFEEGYKWSSEIWEKIKSNPFDGITTRKIEKALNKYRQSLKNNPHIVESAVNMLWLIFINYSLLPDEHAVKMGEAVWYGESLNSDFAKKYMLKDKNPISSESEKNKKAYIRDSQEMVMSLIEILKKSTEYAELADYYIALRYVLGMVDNEYGEEFNKTIGMEMMMTFAEIKNHYAAKWLIKCYEL